MGLDDILLKIVEKQSLSHAEAQMAFSCFDTDNNKTINTSELEEALNKLVARSKKTYTGLVWRAGKATGKVDAARSKAKQDFTKADTDRDGVISWEEFWKVASKGGF